MLNKSLRIEECLDEASLEKDSYVTCTQLSSITRHVLATMLLSLAQVTLTRPKKLACGCVCSSQETPLCFQWQLRSMQLLRALTLLELENLRRLSLVFLSFFGIEAGERKDLCEHVRRMAGKPCGRDRVERFRSQERVA